MNDEKKVRRIHRAVGYGFCLLYGVGLLLLVLHTYGYAAAGTEAERLRILCDAFTIPGVTLMLGAGLMAVYNQGVFTGVTYGLRRVKDIFLPFLRSEYVRYPDYKRQKEEKKIRGYSCMFYTGLALTIPAVYCMIRFYSI